MMYSECFISFRPTFGVLLVSVGYSPVIIHVLLSGKRKM